MLRRTDIKTVLLIRSAPIVIGQACEIDFSGTLACIALKEEGKIFEYLAHDEVALIINTTRSRNVQ